MNWRRFVPWVLLVCELAVLVCLFEMLMIAGISAGFTWWPMPATLGISLILTAACIFFSRKHKPVERWILWVFALLPAAYFSYFIAHGSWKMSHPVDQTWIIPDGYHGPIHVVRSVPQGAVATQSKNRMIFVLDQNGIAVVKEPPDTGWVHSTYLYRHADGTSTPIPEAGPDTPGTIDDTPVNRQDNIRRIYFSGSGETGDGSGCSYKMNEAYLESPHEALTERSTLNEVGVEQDEFLEHLKKRYPGMCSVSK